MTKRRELICSLLHEKLTLQSLPILLACVKQFTVLGTKYLTASYNYFLTNFEISSYNYSLTTLDVK